MKKLLLSIIAVIGLSSVAFAQTTTITKFSGSRITGLDISGQAEVKITQGTNTYFKITLPKEYQSKMILKMDGNTVDLSWVKGTQFNSDSKVIIDMVCNSLEELDCSGGIKVIVNETMRTNELKIDASGAMNFTANSIFIAGKLDIDVSGAAKINMAGKADNCKVDVSGSCDIELSNLEAADVEVEISGAGNCKVWATGMLNIEASGAAKVGYKGAPTIKNETSGRASIYKL